MGILDSIGSAASSAAEWGSEAMSGIGDSLSDIGKTLGFDANDVIKKSVAGAVIAGVSGGDVGKSALWGGFGSIVGGSDVFGEWSNEIGGAISGAGIADASGHDALLGAALGAGYEHMSDTPTAATTKPTKSTKGEYAPAKESLGMNDINDKIDDSESGGGLLNKVSPTTSKLKELGLVDKDGQPTMLGEMAVGSMKGMLMSEAADKRIEEQRKYSQFNSDLQEDRYRARKEADLEYKQRNVGAFGVKR